MPELSLNQVGAQTLTVNTVAAALTLPTGKTPRHALIYTTDKIRWRADGTAPTSTSGMFVAAASWINWCDPQTDAYGLIKNVQFIQDSGAGGNSTVEIAYFT